MSELSIRIVCCEDVAETVEKRILGTGGRFRLLYCSKLGASFYVRSI